MIASLDGVLKQIYDQSVIVSVQGLGFKVAVSNHTNEKLPGINEPISLLIETLIRAEQIQLCGFLEPFEQQCFQKLIQVQGVGVRVAMAILSINTPEQFYMAINAKDAKLIEQADGVGKKLAQRIILELKDKLILPDDVLLEADAPNLLNINIDDATAVLIQLGYASFKIRPIINKIIKQTPEANTQEIVRLVLQNIGGQ